MAAIRLHDTRSGELRELVPRSGGRVGIYACGPTVYGRIHVGNDVYFRVRSDADYGSLSRRAIDEMNQGDDDGRAPVGASLKLAEHGSEAGAEEQELFDEHEAARAARNDAEADRLRGELRACDWEVRDEPHGPELVRIEQ